METTANTIAAEIVRQIGAGALMRIGAHSFLVDGDALIIHSGRGHRNKIVVAYSRVHDTYSVKTLKLKRDLSMVERHIADDVYCEQLAGIIAELG